MKTNNPNISAMVALEMRKSLNKIPENDRLGFLYGFLCGWLISQGLDTKEKLKTVLDNGFEVVAGALLEQFNSKKVKKVCACGFEVGDRVKMTSSIVNAEGVSFGMVHGKVEKWDSGCGHIATWDEMGTVTDLPNPNVVRE